MLRRSAFTFALLLCTALTPVERGRAQDAGQLALTTQQIAELNAEELNSHVKRLKAQKPGPELLRPLEQAELALTRLAKAEAAHDSEAVERNLELARAALSLSETRRALLRERALLAAAKRRQEQTVQRMAQSKQLTDKAKARLNAAREDGGVSP